jgi:two-component system invasion response regulator UvrY
MSESQPVQPSQCGPIPHQQVVKRMKTKTTYRVLVCDDLAMARQQVQQAVANTCEFRVVGEAVNGYECIAKAVDLKPDLVLMDVGLPDLDGAEAARQLVLRVPETKVLAYSADSCWEKVDRMLAAGACGYVVKGTDLDELIRAARTILAGGHYLSLVLLQPIEQSD